MRMKRVLGAATAAALLLTGPLAVSAPAQEEDPPAVPTGVGSGLVSSTLLGVDVGDLLGLDLLDDQSRSTIDPVDGEPISNAVFNPLKVTSTVLDPLSLGSVATSSTGAEDRKSVSKNLGSNNIPVPIASGVLNGALSSVVDGNGARSSLLAGIGDLDLVGGLLGMSANPEAVTFTTNAAPANAGGVRSLNIPSMELLNLGNLLSGIGTPLESLPLVGDTTSITGLLEGLGIDSVPVAGEDMATSEVVTMVTDLVDSLDVLNATGEDTPLTDTLCSTLQSAAGPVLGGVLGGGGMDDDETCTTALDSEGTIPVVGELVANVEDLLTPILEGSLPVLDDLNLLEAEGISAAMQATATESVDSSVADVVASIGSLKVANLDVLEDLDLTQGLDVLAGVGDTISETLNTGLGMEGLLDVDVLEITETIAPDGNYTNALSGLRTLGVSLDPASIVGGVSAMQVGGGVPVVSDVLDTAPLGLGVDMLALDGLLEGVTSILTEGLGIEVGTMESEGFFTPVAALPPNIVPPPAQPVTLPANGTLPRTGADTALPAMLAVILAGAAVGVRRVLRSEPTPVGEQRNS
ncbi:MAG: hypothetical protein M3P97_05920 [Actinomycetota bacterium]|nr:hypothetical protein [Actinomycetota bacterium]